MVCNIGKGPVHNTDDEVALAFDQEHGGIMKAISAGLFPNFLKQNDVDAEKEFATVRISKEAEAPGAPPTHSYKIKEIGKPGPEHRTGGVHAALNGLHLKGYTHYESQLKTNETYTFSRRKHTTMSSGATDIFIPNDEEGGQERNGLTKQFATVIRNLHDKIRMIGAPAEFHKDESKKSNPLNSPAIEGAGAWLENNGFATREIAYEDIFKDHFKADLANDVKVSIFSRMIVNENGDESW